MSEVLSHIASSFNPYIRTDITIRNPMIKPHVHVGPIKNTCMTWFVFIHLLLLLCEWNQFSSWESPACFLLATHLEGKESELLQWSTIVKNYQRLSTIVDNCQQLSIIINNCQQLSSHLIELLDIETPAFSSLWPQRSPWICSNHNQQTETKR